ncbi:MAG TPA: T3SS effector HopA1 family protein [Allosphingosinicella sp.]|jgi:hypothetical protein
MTEDFEAKLRGFLDKVRISPAGLAWHTSAGIYSYSASQMPPQSVISPVEARLATLLYWRFYCYLPREAQADQRPGGEPLAYASFLPESYAPETGWTVEAVDEPFRRVAKGDRCRKVVLDEISPASGQPGETVSLRRRAYSETQQPGFFYYFGKNLAGDFDREHVVRIYLNTDADHAVGNCAAIIEWMNRFQVPFLLKSLKQATAFQRTDPAVLYLPRRYFTVAWHGLQALKLCLRTDTPQFTRRLAPGIACADDPRDGISFGQHRCLIVARGFLEHALDPDHDPLARVKRCFERAGIDWNRPWLNPGNADWDIL